jgi:hypothetical protein
MPPTGSDACRPGESGCETVVDEGHGGQFCVVAARFCLRVAPEVEPMAVVHEPVEDASAGVGSAMKACL